MSTISQQKDNRTPFNQEDFLKSLLFYLHKENNEQVRARLIEIFGLEPTEMLKLSEEEKEVQRIAQYDNVIRKVLPIHMSSVKAIKYLQRKQIGNLSSVDIKALKKNLRVALKTLKSPKNTHIISKVIIGKYLHLEKHAERLLHTDEERHNQSVQWLEELAKELDRCIIIPRSGRKTIAELKLHVLRLAEIYEELSGQKFTFDKCPSSKRRGYDGITTGYDFVVKGLEHLYHLANEEGCYEVFEDSNIITACSQAVTALRNGNCDLIHSQLHN